MQLGQTILPARMLEPRAVMFEWLFADVWQQRHEPSPLQCRGDRSLERGTIAGSLAAVELALARAEFLETLHVFEIDKSRPRAAVFGAKPAAILASTTQFLANHRLVRPAVC